MHLVDLSPEADALRGAALVCRNNLFDLSLEAGALAGLLKLIAGNTETLQEQHGMAVGKLAEIAQAVEDGIAAIASDLSEAMDAAKNT